MNQFKQYINLIMLVAIVIITYGIIAPALISAKSTIVVIAGILTCVGVPIYIVWVGLNSIR